MPLTVTDRDLGPISDPQDVRKLREANYDYHDQIGQPVILKHRWNEIDERNGLTQKCPFHDNLYQEDLPTCPYCFGTTYLGGFSDGILTSATIADAREDTFRLTNAGTLLHDRSPQVNFPWQPTVGDNDLLIAVELDSDNGNIIDTYERYTLRQAQPNTMRGLGYKNTKNSRPYKVGQQAQIDVVPYGSLYWTVPIVFNYDSVPLPPGSFELGVRIFGGLNSYSESDPINVRISVGGTTDETGMNVRVTGQSGGAVIFID